MQGIVFYGEQFVEVPDSSVTLKDICGSFGLVGDITGVFIRNRASGRVVVTLPFEGLPDTDSLQGDEDNTYDLCVQRTDGADDTAVTMEDMTDVLQQLLRLGAASFLAARPETHDSLEPYDPRAGPGLLARTVYPPSAYSPYRHRRDPLKVQARSAAVAAMTGPPYVSAVEPYTVELATETTLRQRPDLTRQNEEEAQDILRGLVTAATQAKAIIAMADIEEERHAPLDVKQGVRKQMRIN